mmetsp:Transcript_5864/g.13203  ORF Transcript_5864/g.13203 Transcript_5864/m.13203 type:complete len:369 (-) Transcript_5864:109-1215(-)
MAAGPEVVRVVVLPGVRGQRRLLRVLPRRRRVLLLVMVAMRGRERRRRVDVRRVLPLGHHAHGHADGHAGDAPVDAPEVRRMLRRGGARRLAAVHRRVSRDAAHGGAGRRRDDDDVVPRRGPDGLDRAGVGRVGGPSGLVLDEQEHARRARRDGPAPGGYALDERDEVPPLAAEARVERAEAVRAESRGRHAHEAVRGQDDPERQRRRELRRRRHVDDPAHDLGRRGVLRRRQDHDAPAPLGQHSLATVLLPTERGESAERRVDVREHPAEVAAARHRDGVAERLQRRTQGGRDALDRPRRDVTEHAGPVGDGAKYLVPPRGREDGAHEPVARADVPPGQRVERRVRQAEPALPGPVDDDVTGPVLGA